ncbi:MAG: glycogen debranching protein GlgX [Trueperaceae bacterium]
MNQILSFVVPETPSLQVLPGQPFPLGSYSDGCGVNFALYSEHAQRIELLLFAHSPDTSPRAVFLPERTGPVWHGYIPELQPGQLYGYRVHGRFEPERGHRFNARKVLLDPYAKAIGRPLEWHDSLFAHATVQLEHETHADLAADIQDSAAYAPLGAVIDERFDWEGDALLHTPWEDTIIYETHVKSISMKHPDVPSELRGTFLGLASEPVLEHLSSLGVTAVQLLPVQAFVSDRHLVDKGLSNYWGYNTLSYFAPHAAYSHNGPINAVNDFKAMVKTLHTHGLEVLLDVVYNHTGEGSHFGPTLSFRGIDNAAYYKLHPKHKQFYMDYTGTGNTLEVSNPYVLQLMMDSLRYWVTEMHVDGFRFDLTSALAREFYDVNMLSAFFKIIQQDPILSRVKLIAEPWDVGPGGYQVGNFPWYWTEWNGRYRDSTRSYWRGDKGRVAEMATRLAGSSDLYSHTGRKPYASINFITAHDGFTLQDLVSYEHKRNMANGEWNCDGENHNHSLNCGVEGPTDNPLVLHKRETLKRSHLATLLLSQGIPMLLGGDELSRTQHGNNNAYCQDNDLSYYEWNLSLEQTYFLSYVKDLIAFRKAHPTFRRRNFLKGRLANGQHEAIYKDVSWWHPIGREMKDSDWHDENSSSFGMLLCATELDVTLGGQPQHDDHILVLFHGHEATSFKLPVPPDTEAWTCIWTSEPRADEPSSLGFGGKILKLTPHVVSVYKAIKLS